MAHLDKQSGQIILSVEDKEMFKEVQANTLGNRTPIADSIMKWILQPLENNYAKRNNN